MQPVPIHLVSAPLLPRRGAPAKPSSYLDPTLLVSGVGLAILGVATLFATCIASLG